MSERSAVAMARERGARVEVLGERTEHSQTFAKPDGSFVVEESLRPRWVRRADGSWAGVDASLRRLGGVLAPVAATVPMRFSVGGSADPLAWMGVDGVSLGLRWLGSLPAPVVSGNVATYPNVAPHIDLRVVAEVDGFSHLLVIRSAKALSNPLVREFSLDTALSGVSLRVQPGTGVVEAVNSAGAVVFSGPTPMMWDSRGSPGAAGSRQPELAKGAADGDGRAQVEPAMARVAVRVSAGRLTLTPDQALLTDPDTVFPVFVDPTWTKVTGKRNSWSLLRKSHPTSSFYNPAVGSTSSSDATHGIVRAGYVVEDKTYTDRSVFSMNVSAVRYKRVNRATLSLTQSWSWYGCGSASAPVTELRRVSSFSSSTTWNTSWNSTKSGWGAVLATSNKVRKYGYSCGPQKVEYNVTSRVREAAAAGSSSINVGLIARYETAGSWTRFRLDPLLAIEYNSAPNVPAKSKVMGKDCVTGASRPYVLVGQPTFTASASDPDTGQQALTSRFYWWKSGQSRNDSDYVAGTTGNPGTATSAPVPLAKQLEDDTTYVWQARVSDDVGDVAWSGLCEFRTSLTPPDLPAQAASNGNAYPEYNPADPGPGSGGVGVTGTFTIAPPVTGHAEVAGYAYTLDSGVGPAEANQKPKAVDGTAEVQVTPLRDGVNTLRMWTKDIAGRYSVAEMQYQFKVRPGAGPAARWLFDDPNDRGRDDTDHSNAVSMSGGASTGSGRADVGDALSLNGTTAVAATSGGLTQPHPDTGVPTAVRTDTTFTVTAWVKLTATGGSGVTAAVAVDGSRTSPYVLGYSATANRWVFQLAGSDVDNATITSVMSDSAPVAGRWTHLAGTYDAATKALRLYVQGTAQAATATLSGTGFNATGAVTLGRSKWNGAASGYLNGQLDDVRIYSYLAPSSDFVSAATPLPPTITLPSGTITVGTTVQLSFDARGDTNITSFKYSVGSAALDQSINAGVPGGTATTDPIQMTQVGTVKTTV